jgi:hypothetical protein
MCALQEMLQSVWILQEMLQSVWILQNVNTIKPNNK